MSDEKINSHRFRELLDRVAEGEETATREIVEEYGSTILRAVRRRMNNRLRDRFDSEDFAQAVWASFFGHLSIVSRITTEGELAGFLGKMASNKVIDEGRRQKSRPQLNATDGPLPYVVTDNRRKVSQPTPSQFAVANEQWHQLTDNEDDKYQQLLQLLRDGASQAEIAEKLNISDRHVRRIVRRIARKLLREEDTDHD